MTQLKTQHIEEIIASLNLIAQTQGALYVRTIEGVADHITVTNGDGVAGNPTLSLATANADPGTFVGSLTVDAHGRVTAAANLTTLAGYGIVDAQPIDADLTALAALAATAGMLARTGAGAFAVRTITGTTGRITVATGDGSGNPTIDLAGSICTPGTYKSVTVDAYGRTTTGSNPSTLVGYGITDAQPVNADLTAVAGLATNGIIARTGSGTADTRTITSSNTLLSIANGNGVSGNPTITLPLTTGWVIRGVGDVATKLRDVKHEVATTTDVAKLTYAVAKTLVAGTESVYLDGILQKPTTAYSIVAGDILLVVANTTDKVMLVSYLATN